VQRRYENSGSRLENSWYKQRLNRYPYGTFAVSEKTKLDFGS
jgi:hypothetical protein